MNSGVNHDPSYWDRVAADLADALGWPPMTGPDLLIVVPALLAVLVLFTFRLMGWKQQKRRWQRVLRAAVGPCMLYCAFAFWHIHCPAWTVGVFAASGVLVSAVTLRQLSARSEQG